MNLETSILRQCTDPDFCLIAVQSNSEALKYIPETLRDYNLVLNAVSQNGLSLQYADKFQSNKPICIQAIRNNQDALQYVNPELHNDPEILLASINETESFTPSHPILKYIPDHLKKDSKFIERIHARNPYYALLLAPINYTGIAYILILSAIAMAYVYL